ncbi:DUF2145 domain-containing protein [Xylophilus sp. Kf1]|nr:DUF2145 domain-containing protein [Xylophilus sp. Kf1]
MKTGRSVGAAALCCLLFGASVVRAGQACDSKPMDTASIERGMALAQATARALDLSKAQVVILARAGQDLSRWNISWSHIALVYRGPDGRWRVMHKLNQCGTDQAAVYRQGLGEFFLDQPWRYEAAFSVLKPSVQRKLLPVLQDNTWVAQWHTPRYNMLAYPWSVKYQQSNQWAVETLAGALEPAAQTRGRAQAWLELQNYRPAVLSIGPLTRLGARVTAANIAFDDQPAETRYAGRIETMTADSVFEWLFLGGFGSAPFTVRER